MSIRNMARFIKSENGSSLILVLAVIIIISMLGTAALVLSSYNVKLGTNYKNWSVEFFEIDMKAEKALNELDQALKDAEENAAIYIMNEYYKDENGSRGLEGDQHPHIVDGWNKVMEACTHEETILFTPQGSTTPESITIEVFEPDNYTDEMETYTAEAFKKLYYFYAGNITGSEIIDADEFTIPENPDYSFNRDWDSMSVPTNGAITFNMEIKDDDLNQVLDISASLMMPEYEPRIERQMHSFYGNPILTNAISAQGYIDIKGNDVEVFGDTYAESAANDAGIMIDNDSVSSVDFHGNVLTHRDFHIYDSDASEGGINSTSVTIGGTSPDTDITNKIKLYNNGDYFYLKNPIDSDDPSHLLNQIINNYTADTSEGVAYVGKDTEGGNLYCNNLAIDEYVTHSSITVDNVWTNDDLVINGDYSTITVNGNYIGISSYSLSGDPNDNSAIMNGKSFNGSKIILNGDIVVPGVTYYKFAAVEGQELPYYRSAESVSGRNLDIFTGIYMYKPIDAHDEDYIVCTTSAIVTSEAIQVEMYKNPGDEKTWYSFFVDRAVEVDESTEVYVPEKSDVKGYTLGVVLARDDSVTTGNAILFSHGKVNDDLTSSVIELQAYGDNQDDYYDLKNGRYDELKNFYEAKTKYFSLNKTKDEQSDFASYVDKDAISTTPGIIYLDGDTVYTVNSDNNKGIIYSTGNLTLRGDDEAFYGTIISEGDITIEGSIKFYYDEKKIITILGKNEVARSFFAPGMISYSEDTQKWNYEETTTSSGNVNLVKRYRIDQWKEAYIEPEAP